MKFSLDILQEYIDKKLVVKQTHPTLPLSIYNYSRTCQFDRLWDDITLNCRALILDNEGNVIAKSFPKFFNMEELEHKQIPNEPFEVFEKMDGSLGLFFYYQGEWHMATKGSFISPQSVKGMLMAKKYNLDKICVPGYTYLFEIIYPENMICVNYGDSERLVLLSIMDSEGVEIPYEDIVEYGEWDIVNRYDGISDYSILKGMIANDAEGFVVRFKSGMRMKIKGEEYVRLHAIKTNISTTSIWETLSNGGTMEDILYLVPDEVAEKVVEVIKDLAIRFDNVRKDYLNYYSDIVSKVGLEDKKAFAEQALRYNHSSILFSLLNGRDINPNIWKIIKPKWRKIFASE